MQDQLLVQLVPSIECSIPGFLTPPPFSKALRKLFISGGSPDVPSRQHRGRGAGACHFHSLAGRLPGDWPMHSLRPWLISVMLPEVGFIWDGASSAVVMQGGFRRLIGAVVPHAVGQVVVHGRGGGAVQDCRGGVTATWRRRSRDSRPS